MIDKGFFVVSDPEVRNGPQEIFSNSGDITIQLADGARYILRFGETTGESSAAEKKKKANAKSGKEDKAKDDVVPGMDRYLFVTADFNQDAIPKPVVEKLPEDKPAEKAVETKADAKDAKPADGDKKEPRRTKKTKPRKSRRMNQGRAPAKVDDANKDDAKKEEPKKGEAKADAPAKGDNAKKVEPKKDDAAKEAKDPQRYRRAETNRNGEQAAAGRYDGKVAAGKKHAKELSDRFAQWYYVISARPTPRSILITRRSSRRKSLPRTRLPLMTTITTLPPMHAPQPRRNLGAIEEGWSCHGDEVGTRWHAFTQWSTSVLRLGWGRFFDNRIRHDHQDPHPILIAAA